MVSVAVLVGLVLVFGWALKVESGSLALG